MSIYSLWEYLCVFFFSSSLKSIWNPLMQCRLWYKNELIYITWNYNKSLVFIMDFKFIFLQYEWYDSDVCICVFCRNFYTCIDFHCCNKYHAQVHYVTEKIESGLGVIFRIYNYYSTIWWQFHPAWSSGHEEIRNFFSSTHCQETQPCFFLQLFTLFW